MRAWHYKNCKKKLITQSKQRPITLISARKAVRNITHLNEPNQTNKWHKKDISRKKDKTRGQIHKNKKIGKSRRTRN